jgi:transcriptional regulator with XRE-family HTH domain
MNMKVMLKTIRGDRNLEDIAAKLDVAVSTIQRWERQTMSIPSFRLPAIAEAYGCRISDIFADDGSAGRP